MDIKEYKMCDIISFKTGIDKNNINSFNSINSLPWIKLGNINEHNVNYDSCEYLSDTKNIVIKGDILLVWSCDIGKSIIINDKSLFSTAFYKLVPKKDNIYLNKYIHYFFIKNKKEIGSLGNGSVLKKANMKILGNFILKLPNISVQQSIIDIIEPKEKLFLKFKNLVRIDNIENCKNDMKNLIDIIEPFEILVESVLKKIRINLKITELIINNFYRKNGLFKENEIEFFKGINFKKEMISENNSDILFINVSAINDKPNKFIKLEYINMINVFEGDVVLSLDGNTGLVNNCLKGINGYGYKIASDKIKNSQIYYSLLSKINQDIINQNSFGTTIQHASKSKDKIILLNFGENQKILDIFFDLEIIYKKKAKLLKKIISSLIEIYTR